MLEEPEVTVTNTEPDPAPDTQVAEEQEDTVEIPDAEETIEAPVEDEQEDDQPSDFSLEEGFYDEVEETDNSHPLFELDINHPDDIEKARKRWNEHVQGLVKREDGLKAKEDKFAIYSELENQFQKSEHLAKKQVEDIIAVGRQLYGDGFYSQGTVDTDAWNFDDDAKATPDLSNEVAAALKGLGFEPEVIQDIVRERESQKQRAALEQHIKSTFPTVKGRVAQILPELQFTEDDVIKAVESFPELAKKPHLAVFLKNIPELRKQVYREVRGNKRQPEIPNRGTAKVQGQKPSTLKEIMDAPLGLI